MNNSTFNFKASSDNVGQIFIDGPIGEDWWADDGGNTTKKISDILDELKALNCDSYHVKIHSLGGDVDHALAIYSLLKSLPNVTTEVIGMCASAATVIFMAGKERIIDSSALLLIHHCWSVSNGNAMQMERTVETMRVIDETMIDIYTEATGLSRAEVEELMDANDGDGRWITADECKKKKLCTAVTSAPKADSRSHFFALADIKERNLPIPEQMEELSPSTWAKISNLIKSLTKSQPTMNNFNLAPFACLAALFSELMADDKGNAIIDADGMKKIDEHISSLSNAKAELEAKISTLETQLSDAAALSSQQLEALNTANEKVKALQALVDAHANIKPANAPDPVNPSEFDAYYQNSAAYAAAEELLRNY